MENPNLHEMDDLGGSILGIIEIHGGGSPILRNQHSLSRIIISLILDGK